MAPGAGGRWARWLQLGLSLYAAALFTALWVAFVVAESTVLDGAWQWLTDLPLPAEVLAWVLVLPGAFWLWLRQAGLEPFWEVAAITALIAWTLLAFGGLYRAIRLR
jgi:formate hydrogenlyase subunit 4